MAGLCLTPSWSTLRFEAASSRDTAEPRTLESMEVQFQIHIDSMLLIHLGRKTFGAVVLEDVFDLGYSFGFMGIGG